MNWGPIRLIFPYSSPAKLRTWDEARRIAAGEAAGAIPQDLDVSNDSAFASSMDAGQEAADTGCDAGNVAVET